MIPELDGLTALGAELARRATRAGVLLIARAQSRSIRSVLARRGRVESSSLRSASGIGLQVVAEDGRTALAARDDLEPDGALALLERVIGAARHGADLGVTPGHLVPLTPHRGREIAGDPGEFAAIEPDLVGRRLVELESAISARVPRVGLRTSFSAELEAWRIFRDDGTDVSFAVPRCILGCGAATEGDGARHAVSASAFGTRPRILWDDGETARFLSRAQQAARLARDLPDAPNHPSGSFPLVIDYALAKGLAHEAFGHAAEADGFRSSVLAREGRYRSGETVGPDHVSIIDEPVPGDHAWQPFSLDGLPRERATIVDRGRLADGLADAWSAGPAGVRSTGAARAQSFRHAPQPRMTNIRIEVDRPLPAPGRFEDYGPEQVRALLTDAGVLRRHPRVVYLSGYTGGQVNPATGDFVFHCKAIWDIGRDGLGFHKPAIFSGSMFGALQSVREAFGPLALDAIGYCGKWGQRVPSSGGSHYFLVLDPHPDVRLGGG